MFLSLFLNDLRWIPALLEVEVKVLKPTMDSSAVRSRGESFQTYSKEVIGKCKT